jgi:hypothetical protein
MYLGPLSSLYSTYVFASLYAYCIHTYTHTYMHTYIHTHTCIQTHRFRQSKLCIEIVSMYVWSNIWSNIYGMYVFTILCAYCIHAYRFGESKLCIEIQSFFYSHLCVKNILLLHEGLSNVGYAVFLCMYVYLYLYVYMWYAYVLSVCVCACMHV